MIDPADFLRVVVDPGVRFLSGIMAKDMGTDPAKVMLLAIALQESGLEHRRQIDSTGKPMATLARGWYQFEAGGGVAGVCSHAASKDPAAAACAKLLVPFNQADIHESLAWHDQLATVFARLLLFTDPAPLPAIGDQQGALDYYLYNWRPKGWENPSQEIRDRWARHYPVAVQAVATAAAATTSQPFIAPKPGTLTATTAGGTTQVDLPEMNRSWTTGSFWLSAGSGVLYALVLLAPVLEPAMDHLGSSAWLAALPLGLGPVFYAVAREWYKAKRVEYAAQVAAASATGRGSDGHASLHDRPPPPGRRLARCRGRAVRLLANHPVEG